MFFFLYFFMKSVPSFFRRRKKKQKVGGDYYRDCIPADALVAIVNCSPLWLRNALLGVRYEVLKPRPLGEVAAIADGEGLFPVICGRTQFVSTVVLASYYPQGRAVVYRITIPPSFRLFSLLLH